MADCKRKTANLFDVEMEQGSISASGGNQSSLARIRTSTFIPLEAGNYVINASASNDLDCFVFIYNTSGTFVERVPSEWTTLPYTFTLSENCKIKVVFAYRPAAAVAHIVPSDVSNIMLNTGSTALPYEPYGWVHSLRKLGTATDTITSLPADLYADGNSATVGLRGNMSQTGTPTPQNPIQPQETGGRTNNLLDLAKIEKGRINQTSGEVTVVSDTTVLTVSGNNVTVTTTKDWRGFISDYIPTTDALKFSYGSLSNVESGTTFHCYFYAYDSSKQYLGYVYQGVIPEGTAYLRASFQFNVAVTNAVVSEIMLNSVSTALPYEPYGYKIPISSASTTTPVYLGEVETTRKIKKYEFTGNESWSLHPTLASWFQYNITSIIVNDLELCTHYKPSPNAAASLQNGEILATKQAGQQQDGRIIIKDENYTTTTDFKTYLQQQYAAGTPVTIWYVLEEPTTGIVNEPLRKIGDYADTVSGITIPTITGKDTFDVLTTLKPSEVTANYHGWHTGAVHERESGSWD